MVNLFIIAIRTSLPPLPPTPRIARVDEFCVAERIYRSPVDSEFFFFICVLGVWVYGFVCVLCLHMFVYVCVVVWLCCYAFVCLCVIVCFWIYKCSQYISMVSMVSMVRILRIREHHAANHIW